MFLFTKNLDSKKESWAFEIFFKLTMLWRIVYGTIKLIFGFYLIQKLPGDITNLVYKLFSSELLEDPRDIFIYITNSQLEKLSEGTIFFIAMYLFFWGFIDVFISYYLLKKKIWAYPTAIILITLFTIYELLRFLKTNSLILFLFIIIDIFIIYIINKKYKILKNTVLIK